MRNGKQKPGIVAMGAALAALLLSGPAAAQSPPLFGAIGVGGIGDPVNDSGTLGVRLDEATSISG